MAPEQSTGKPTSADPTNIEKSNAMLVERNRFLLIQIFRTGLWLSVIQTLLWVVQGVRDGMFVEWSVHELGPVGDLSGLYALTILFTLLAFMPVLIAWSDGLIVKRFVWTLSVFFLICAFRDWVGYQSPLPYQLILKVAHTSLSVFAIAIAWRWLKQDPCA